MINELTMTNFRGFGSLELKGLKRVNLIVGHNNAGKTSLLEGLFLLTNPPRIGELPGLFRPFQGDSRLRYFPWLIKDGAKNENTMLAYHSGPEEFEWKVALVSHGQDTPQLPKEFYPPTATIEKCLYVYSSGRTKDFKCRAISVYNRDDRSLVALIGKAYRKRNGEETVQGNLAKIDPRIKKVRIDPGERDEGNQIIVDIGLSELVPISQVGQGIYRVVSILAEVIGEDLDVLLIDEIENGLHHSVMSQVWTGLAEIAEKLGVQIFATTHSGECLQAAHKAFQKRENYDLSVIQLFRNETGVQGRVLDQEHIKAAIAEDIELR